MADSNVNIDICNRALYRLGENPITELGEGSTQANVCQAIYPAARDVMLSWQSWPFATVRQPCPRLAATPASDYDYYYALPSQPLLLRVIDIDLDKRSIDYQRELYVDPNDPNDQRAALATNAESVVVRYVGRVTEGIWMPLFTEAVTVYLAQAIAPAIQGKGSSVKTALLAELYGANGQGGLLQKLRDIIGHEDSPRQMLLPTSYEDARGLGGWAAPTRYP